MVNNKIIKTIPFDDQFRVRTTKNGPKVSRGKGVVRKTSPQIHDMQNGMTGSIIDSPLPFPKLWRRVIEALVIACRKVGFLSDPKEINDAVINIYEQNATHIAFMDVCSCAGINYLTATDAADLKWLLKTPEGQILLTCLVDVTLSHNIACKHGEINPRSGVLSKFSFDIPTSVIKVEEVPNQLFLIDIIHKWLEKQMDFQLGFKVLVTNFDPAYYVYQFVTNYGIDYKFYLEILDPEIKKYIIETQRTKDPEKHEYIRSKYKYKYFNDDFSAKF